MPIVNGSYTRFNMVQDFRDGEPLDAGCRHHAGRSPAKIVGSKVIDSEMLGIDPYRMVNRSFGNVLPVSWGGKQPRGLPG